MVFNKTIDNYTTRHTCIFLVTIMTIKKKDLLEFSISRLDNLFNMANLKASLLLTTNSVIIGALLSVYCTNHNEIGKSSLSLAIKLGFFFSLLFSFLSSFYSILVVVPFLKTLSNDSNKKSLLFFEDISAMKINDYIDGVNTIDKKSFIEDLSIQSHILSAGLSSKYSDLKTSARFLGVCFWGLFYLGVLIIIVL